MESYPITSAMLESFEQALTGEERSRAAAEYCARKLGWQAVECAFAGRMRPVEDIGREVLALARAALG